MNVRFSIQDIRLLGLKYELIDEQSKQEDKATNSTPPKEIDVAVEITCESSYKKPLLRVTVTASLRHDPGLEFSLSAKMGGIFELDSDPNEKTLDQIRRINCPAIIYPYLREVIAETTRKAGYDPIHLPPINFVRIANIPKKNEQE